MRRSRATERGETIGEFAGAVDEVPARSEVEAGLGAAEGPPLGVPTMGRGYERVMTRVFMVDVAREYEELEAKLKFLGPAHKADYAELVDALDEATDNARRAHLLVVSGKVALEVFELDNEIMTGDMRAQAVHALQVEKDKGQRAKAITDADVESHMAAKFSDEYRATKERRAKAKRMVDHLERLADLWKTRCGTLDTMVKGSRRL